MFSKVEIGKKCEFLDKAKIAREERALERHKDLSAIKIQASWGFVCNLIALLDFQFTNVLYNTRKRDKHDKLATLGSKNYEALKVV